MIAEEYLYCIKKLNPDAHVVVWTNDDGSLTPAWDDAHVGIKPTEDDCQAVLAEVQADLAAMYAPPDDPLSDLVTALINNNILPSADIPASLAALPSIANAMKAKQ
jgi:hypothetical protein